MFEFLFYRGLEYYGKQENKLKTIRKTQQHFKSNDFVIIRD